MSAKDNDLPAWFDVEKHGRNAVLHSCARAGLSAEATIEQLWIHAEAMAAVYEGAMLHRPSAIRLADAIDTHEASRLIGYEQGRADERAAVVAWLRQSARTTLDAITNSFGYLPPADAAIDTAADEIERGDHVRTK